MTLRVFVAVALPGRQEVIELELPRGTTAGEAVRAARVAERFPELDVAACRLGIWSRPCEPGTALRDGDRVEIHRPLAADPKAARRSRARVRPSTRSRSGP